MTIQATKRNAAQKTDEKTAKLMASIWKEMNQPRLTESLRIAMYPDE